MPQALTLIAWRILYTAEGNKKIYDNMSRDSCTGISANLMDCLILCSSMLKRFPAIIFFIYFLLLRWCDGISICVNKISITLYILIEYNNWKKYFVSFLGLIRLNHLYIVTFVNEMNEYKNWYRKILKQTM